MALAGTINGNRHRQTAIHFRALGGAVAAW
jgi:hypothetical protein